MNNCERTKTLQPDGEADRFSSADRFCRQCAVRGHSDTHRFSKSQQDSLLGAVERGIVTLIGATTENPSFEMIRPLLSRCQLYGNFIPLITSSKKGLPSDEITTPTTGFFFLADRYFIDNDDYFQNRLQVIDENGVEYEDNDARAIFYARGVLETVKKLRWCPDVIHCHGWMTALAPLYIKKAYKDEPSFRDAKVVFSLYDNDFKQPFHSDFTSKLLLKGINKKDIADLKEPIDYIALCKLAIDYSDGIIQQSEHVNEELMEYARQAGKPILGYQSPENFADACNDFYDQVWGAEQE